jgi:hypothetical protein
MSKCCRPTLDQRRDHSLKERVARPGGHESVGRETLQPEPGALLRWLRNDQALGLSDEVIEWPEALDVQVDIHAAKVVQETIADGVGTLDVVGILIVGGE